MTFLTSQNFLHSIDIIISFLNHRKRNQQNPDENVYDSKSIGSNSGHYNNQSTAGCIDEYQNVSIVSSISSMAAHKKLNKKASQSEPTQTGATGFHARLKSFYSSLNKTLQLPSSSVLSETTKKSADLKLEENATAVEKLQLNKNSKQTSSFNINEFNPNDVDVKYEKDIPIDRLRLFKSSTRSLKSVASLYKKNNIELEQEKQLEKSRLENTYVSNPIAENNSPTNTNEINSEENENDKLNIYEVNFDNNFAYIMPQLNKSQSSLVSNKSSSTNNKVIIGHLFQI
jgi:hypothetical protein